jgi:hypothetical protein
VPDGLSLDLLIAHVAGRAASAPVAAPSRRQTWRVPRRDQHRPIDEYLLLDCLSLEMLMEHEAGGTDTVDHRVAAREWRVLIR